MSYVEVDYVEAVTAAAGCLRRGEQANWELSRLTFERTFSGRGDTEGQTALGKVALSKWCLDVRQASGGKFSDKTGAVHRRVWDRFRSVGTTDRPSWTEAYIAVVPSASSEATLERHAEQHVREASPERKRALIIRLLNDPDLATPEAMDGLAALLVARRREVRGMPPVPPAIPLEEQEATAAADPYGVSGALRLAICMLDGRAAANAFAEALRLCPTLSASARALIGADLTRVRREWQGLEALVADGAVLREVEAFLAWQRATTEPTTIDGAA